MGFPGQHPLDVTSDRGPEFVSRFSRSLGKALDMKLHFTSGYHPEGNRQTEPTNQTLEQYLRIFCNYQQDNWYTLLPLAEFTYNNTLSATTGISPFFANKGYHPNLTVHPECDLASVRAKDLVVNLDDDMFAEVYPVQCTTQKENKRGGKVRNKENKRSCKRDNSTSCLCKYDGSSDRKRRDKHRSVERA